MKKKILGAAVVGLLALTGCTTSTAAEPVELQKVSVILDWSPNTNHSGLYLAQRDGLFADAGLDVTLIEPGDTSGLQLVAAGQADFALSVAESLLPARDKGLPVVSVATVMPHNTSSLISLGEKNITRPLDLEGTTYGGYEGELEKALISELVTCDGGDPSKVEFIPLPGDDFRIGLTQDMYDTAWVFNGWDTIRLRDVDGLDVNTIDFLDWTECIPDWYTPLVAASEQTIADKPELVKSFLSAASLGYAKASAEPEQAVEALMAAAPELDRELVTHSATYLADKYIAPGSTWGVQDPAVWTKFSDFLAENNLFSGDLDVTTAWNGTLLPPAS